MKNILFFCLTIVSGVLMSSCSNDIVEQRYFLNEPTNLFLGDLFAKTDSMAKQDIMGTMIDNTAKRKIIAAGVNVPLYVVIPPGNTPSQKNEIKEQFSSAQCAAELVRIAEETGSVLTTEYDEGVNYEILISESKVKEALKPMIQSSKEFLYTKGFTDQEIKSMLAENNADEADLIRLVLYVSSDENNQNSMANRNSEKGFDVFDLFAMPAYAGTVQKTYWQAVWDCVQVTLGLDFIGYAHNSTATKWTKAAMRKAFKAIAKKCFGHVGLAIGLVEFRLCMLGADYISPDCQSSVLQ